MRPISFPAFACAFAVTALAVVLLAGRAEAQCITGPSALCGGAPVQLCAPSGSYSYEWTGPNRFSSDQQCITATAAGRYRLTVFDVVSGALVCSGFKDVTNATAPVASISGATSVCQGLSTQWSGPAGNYSYSWSGPAGFAAATQSVSVSVSGSYQLVVTDNVTSCVSAPASQSLSVLPAPLASVSGPSAVCAGSSADLCGPSGNLSWAWSGPSGFTSSSQCVSVNVAGSYQLVVTDLSTGCASSPVSHSLSVSPLPVASISGPSAVCAGSSANLCGPSGNFSYAWSGPGGFSASSSCVSASAAGTYRLVVTDNASGCVSSQASHDLSVSAVPVASISGPASVCSGSNANLCGPSGNFQYAWSGPGGFSASGSCVSVGVAGSYQLVVTDNATGCASAAASHLLSVSSLPVATITGNGGMCAGGSTSLCGPSGNYTFAWTGPGGMTASTQCVTATASGAYQLVVTDVATGCVSAQASQNLATSPAPVAGITGASDACLGTEVELCGPSGNFSYLWSGPSGMSGTTACVTVTATGTYRLVLTDRGTGCSAAPVTHSVAFNDCRTLENCPKPPSFWRKASRGEEHPTPQVDLAAISKSVDEHSSFFKWGSSPSAGFKATVGGGRGALASLAARQFAVVWANVVASDFSASARGRAIVLKPSTQIQLPGVSTTVSAWLASTDATLSSLVYKDERDGPTKAAYRKIISVGLHVNHGFGIGQACGRGGNDDHGSDPNAADADPNLDELSAELEEELGGMDVTTSVEPNPFTSSARVSFVVASTASANVEIGVYDLAGRMVRELASGSFQPGSYQVRWDGRDASGGLARNGVYFVLTRVGGNRVESRLTLLR